MDPRLTQVGPTREAAARLAEEERKRKEAQALLAARMGLPMWDPQASQLPTMTTTAEAPDALAVRLARMERPEFEGVPAVTRDRPGVMGTLGDMAIQLPAAAGSMVSRFGEGALRKLEDIPRVGEYFGRGADAIKANAEVLREVTAPKTTEGKFTRGVADIGVSALPYMAAGGGALGLLRSAAMTGIESETDEGSMVKGMADLTGSDALQRLADSPFRTAADVGVDMAFNLIPGARGAYRAMTRDVRHAGNMAGITERVRRSEIATEGGDEWARRQARFGERGVPEVRQVMAAYGETGTPMPRARAVDQGFKKRVADWYDKAKSTPTNPETVRAYRAFADETRKQFEYLKKQGVKFEFVDNPAPYANSAEMMRDIAENNRLVSYKTPPTDFHPLLSAEENDMFRAVHDYFGHAGYGHQFGELGEENAYRLHSAMFSPEARRAMATETRGQNSWVNTRPENKAKPGTVYAEQKVTLMPEALMGVYPGELRPTFPNGRRPLTSLRDEGAVRLAQVGAGARQMGRNVRGMAQAGIDDLRRNPNETAALLALLGEGLVPGASTLAGLPLAAGTTGRVPIENWSPTSRIFDREGVPDMQGTLAGDPRLQMEQYPGPKANPSELVQAIASSKVVPRVLDEDAERGVKMGGLSWYDLGPIRAFFQQRLGLPAFDEWNTIGSAASQSNSVPAEISAASIINFARKNGLDLEEAKSIARDMFRQGNEPGKLPLIYQSHRDIGERGIEAGHVILPNELDSDAWKIPGYHHGRAGGGTTDITLPGSSPALDRHEKYRLIQAAMQDPAIRKLLEQVGLDKPGASLPLRNALDYRLISNIYADGAKRMGLITPQQYQAARWTGGFDKTGLQSPAYGDFTQILEDLVLMNAQQRGLKTSRAGLQNFFEDVARGNNMLMPWSGTGPIPIRE